MLYVMASYSAAVPQLQLGGTTILLYQLYPCRERIIPIQDWNYHLLDSAQRGNDGTEKLVFPLPRLPLSLSLIHQRDQDCDPPKEV